MCSLYSKRDNKEIVIGNEVDEIMQEHFDSLLQRYKKDLKESMKGDELVFDGVVLLHYKCHEKFYGWLIIDSSQSTIKSKKSKKPFNFLLVTFYILFVTFHSLVFTTYSLLFILLFIRRYLFVAHYFLLVICVH